METFMKEKGAILKCANAVLSRCQAPVSEEQVWALCYECCCRMDLLGRGSSKRSFRGPPPQDTPVINRDGSVSFVSGRITDPLRPVKTDKEVIYCLGWILFQALELGIPHDEERVLSQSLEELLGVMMGFDCPSINSGKRPKHSCTFKDIIEVCKNRLVNPLEAEIYYKDVCQVEFTKQCPRKTYLAKLEIESPRTPNDWSRLWMNVVKELRNGIQLNRASERLYKTLPVKYECTPFEHLMDDIRYRRYTLQKATASERKLKDLSYQEPCLHERLMTEIRSSKVLRSWSAMTPDFYAGSKTWHGNRYKDLVSSGYQPTDSGIRKSVRKIFVDRKGRDQDSQETPRWKLEYSSEGSLENSLSPLQSCSTELDPDFEFVPLLTSSKTEKRNTSVHRHKDKFSLHRRSRSLESGFQSKDLSLNKASTLPASPPTIAELIASRQATKNSDIHGLFDILGCKRSSKHKVCFSCHKKELFFTWPYECQICDGVVCPDCCIEMLMPFKHCIHLPVSFLKALMTTRAADCANQTQEFDPFFTAVRQWDCSRVPVVFEPYEMGAETSLHKKAMRDWFSMDVCTKCKEYLLNIIDTNQRSTAAEVQRRLRSIFKSVFIFRSRTFCSWESP
ncbi:protein spire homolog 1-like isoform X2 [Lissotriton helveticus]